MRQLLKRRDVRDLIERKQHPPRQLSGGVGLVGRAADLSQQAAHDRRGSRLRLSRRVDVDRIAGAHESGDVEVRVSGAARARSLL
jgi:hypothetical protein